MKKIKYIDIKKTLQNNSLKVISKLSNEDEFLNIKSITNASEKDLTFFSNEKYLNDLKNIKAKACLINEKYTKYLPSNCSPIIVSDPYLALALISNMYSDENTQSNRGYKGISYEIQEFIENFLSGEDGTGRKGAYQTHIDSINSQNDRIDDKVEQLTRYLESREEQLSQSFMKMEEMQSKMDTQMQTLQNSLPKKSSNK